MHLAEMAMLRAVPAAGVFLALTRRCPLSCAHCSTESAMDSAEHAERPFRRLVATFTEAEHPRFVAMSGGEALLRPGLVRDLAESARLAGTKSYLLSGLYFAREGRAVPAALRAAIAAVDHFAVSLDRFHEREVDRRTAFRVLREVRSWGPRVSVQITGDGDDDPYVAELVREVRREFADQVPMLVTPLRPVGRA
ncbi:radical SAM protein, partial [Nonomuraea sp. NPDC004297]